MSESRTASEIIVDEVTSWPGIETAIGERGELSLRLGRREIGHLHGDHAAHFGFPRQVASELREAGRIGPHPAFPDNPGWGARRIRDKADVHDVIALLQLNYDRALARHGLPEASAR